MVSITLKLKNPKKNQKNPIKPKKAQKNPAQCFFFKNPGFCPPWIKYLANSGYPAAVFPPDSEYPAAFLPDLYQNQIHKNNKIRHNSNTNNIWQYILHILDI